MAQGFYKLPDDMEKDIDVFEGEVRKFLKGEIPAGVFKARRVPRGIYEQRVNGLYMLRMRVSGGIVTAAQLRGLAAVAREHGIGSLHITTRQDIQVHDLPIDIIPGIMRKLVAFGLTAKGGGGNTVRNITACPFAGICASELFDVTPAAHAMTGYLISLVGSYNLPRKYKIALSGCSADCALGRANDLGLIAKVKDGKPGFQVFGGGGMGGHSRIADLMSDWMPLSEATRAGEAMRRFFDKHGNRADKHKARLRFVFDKLGADACRKEYLETLGAMAAEGVPACTVETPVFKPASSGPPTLKTDGPVRYYEQRQPGLVAVPLNLPLGFITPDDMDIVANLAEKYCSDGCVAATRFQTFFLRNVRKGDLARVAEGVKTISAGVVAPGAIENFVACAGASTCRLGLCLSREVAKACASELDKAGFDIGTMEGMKVHISGCPNACGQHPIAALGFHGAARRHGGRLVPAYRVSIGGGVGRDSATLGQNTVTIAAKRLPAFLRDMLLAWKKDRAAGESPASYFAGRGAAKTSEIAAKYDDVPSYEQDPDFYRDWGSSEDFSLAGRGQGECGAGVFEVIQEDLATARKALEQDGDIFKALVAAARALLITRGVDAQDPAGVFVGFEQYFIGTGLVDGEFRGLISRGRGYAEGWKQALDGRRKEIESLVARVALLYSTLDANLAFHPPEAAQKAPPAVSLAPAAAASDQKMDLGGVACPMNFVKAKLRLEMMDVGQTLQVILDDGEPIRNVPASFKVEGQEVLETKDLANGKWSVLIRKKQ